MSPTKKLKKRLIRLTEKKNYIILFLLNINTVQKKQKLEA